MKNIRLILNGKKAGLEPLRAAIFTARKKQAIEVRVTWEAGDVERFVAEAMTEKVPRLMIGGGDGSVKEVVDALMKYPCKARPELAILPLGTANDFATACTIPTEFIDAISLAQQGKATMVDCIKANDEHFINAASGGFGAKVTTTTPVELKNFLGGGAYTLNGLVQALNFTPYQGEIIMPTTTIKDDIIVSAVCNSRQAGGGQQLAPSAFINDGLIDVVTLHSFPSEELLTVANELLDPEISGTYVKRYQVPWVKWKSSSFIPTNLDGEPIKAKQLHYEVVANAIKLVLPTNCPVLK
ncbi:MAG: lipid kinase YegS [Colwellia sp.]